MARRITALIIILLAVFALSNSAFAGDKADGVYTVGFSGSTDRVSVFAPNEKPWLFVKSDEALSLIPRSRWFDPSSDKFKNSIILAGSQGFWLSFTDDYWANIVQPGNWRVKAFEGKGQDRTLLGRARFVVTPEPISATLFVIGAGVLGIAGKRKNMKSGS